MAAEKVQFQGLPARICWLGQGERHLAGLAFNDLVACGAVSAPIVIGRDHLDCGSVASPYRETEAMLDGSDAIADWPLLNAMVNVASRRVLGLDPPRRRRRHRPLDPRRPGERRRRHRAGRAEARARADQRPGAWASSATSTRATSAPRRSPPSAASASRWRNEPAYHADYAWLGGERVDADVLIDGRPTGGSRPWSPGRQAAARGDAPARRDAARAGERALARVPARAARAHAARRRLVLDVAGGHVRARRAAHARRHAPARARHLPRDAAGRDHVRGGVRLRAPQRGADRRRGRGRHPAHAARRVLPRGRVRRAAQRRPAALQRRRRGALGASACRTIKGAKVGAAIHSVRAVPADQLPTVVEFAAGPAAALPRLRAARRERGVPRRARRHAGAAAGRARRARPGLDRRPRHPPHRRRPRAAGRDHDLHVPDDRARPRRRHRPRRARSSPSAATATRSSTSSRRPARSSSTCAWRPSAAATSRRTRSCEARPTTRASAGPRPAGSSPARSPTSSRVGLDSPAPGDRRARDDARVDRLRRHRRRRPHASSIVQAAHADRQHRHAGHQRPRARHAARTRRCVFEDGEVAWAGPKRLSRKAPGRSGSTPEGAR